MSPADRRVLVVEDDADIRGLIERALTGHGFNLRSCGDGVEALRVVEEWRPELVTLDLGLPGLDGLEVCRRLRTMSDVYVVIVSAREDEVERLLCFEAGADDYMLKPFSPRELRARVAAMFRRPRGQPVLNAAADGTSDHEVLVRGSLRVDVDGRNAYAGEGELALTRTEFDLLTQLMRKPSRVFPRETLLRQVWGEDWAGETHLVEVHMGNLRRKLARALDGQPTIRTIRGVGYRME